MGKNYLIKFFKELILWILRRFRKKPSSVHVEPEVQKNSTEVRVKEDVVEDVVKEDVTVDEFKQKYVITPKYLTTGSKRRSGILISPAVKFIVVHDTGNPGSTAANNVKYFKDTENKEEVSAHIFVDDTEILECIPALTSEKPEKAWHVLYGKPKDNELFGYNANDAAIGVEYCYGDNINADEAYRKYTWVVAYICFKFGLDPKNSIVGHHILDPGRKTDPTAGLAHSGRTYEQLLKDVELEYKNCKTS